MNENKHYCKQFADNLRALRMGMNLSQTEFAKLIGKDKQFVQRLESGKVDPLLSTVCKIADAVDKPVTNYFKGREN